MEILYINGCDLDEMLAFEENRDILDDNAIPFFDYGLSQHRHFICAFDGKKCLGMFVYHINRLYEKPYIGIAYVSVRSDYQLQGIATKLVQYFLNMMQEQYYEWTVRVSIYTHMGFDYLRKVLIRESEKPENSHIQWINLTQEGE